MGECHERKRSSGHGRADLVDEKGESRVVSARLDLAPIRLAEWHAAQICPVVLHPALWRTGAPSGCHLRLDRLDFLM